MDSWIIPESKLTRKIGIYLSYIMQILMVVLTIYSAYIGFWVMVFWGAFATVLTFAPQMIKRRFKVTLPWELNFLIILSLFLHLGGIVRDWYYIIPLYDKMAHFIASATIAILGFVAAVIVDQYTDIDMNEYMIVFIIIIFTVAIGTFWEISEFVYDSLTGAGMQKSLNDTMWDLIFDVAGGVIIAFFGWGYLKKMPKERFVKELVDNDEYEEDNTD